jgi:hypothetical protein
MFYSICGGLIAAPLFGVAYAASKGKIQWAGTITFLMFSLGYFYFCIMFFVDSSELMVDDAGLARRIFGRLCMQIPWTGIKVIREQFLLNQRYGGEIRIDVIPRKIHGIALRFRRTIKFSEQIESFDELVDILNARAEQYSIRVEIASKGIWKSRAKLLARVATQETS